MTYEKRRRITHKSENTLAHDSSTVILTSTAPYMGSSWRHQDQTLLLQKLMKRANLHRQFSIIENKISGHNVYICIRMKKIRAKPLRMHGFTLKAFLSKLKFTPLWKIPTQFENHSTYVSIDLIFFCLLNIFTISFYDLHQNFIFIFYFGTR